MGGSLRAMQQGRPYAWLKPGVLLGSLAPLVLLIMRASNGTLGANPIAELLNTTGLLALILLVASLACTPLKRWFELTWPLRIRKLLGLLPLYAAQTCSYVALDKGGERAARRRLEAAVTLWLGRLDCWCAAITSTRAMMRLPA